MKATLALTALMYALMYALLPAPHSSAQYSIEMLQASVDTAGQEFTLTSDEMEHSMDAEGSFISVTTASVCFEGDCLEVQTTIAITEGMALICIAPVRPAGSGATQTCRTLLEAP